MNNPIKVFNEDTLRSELVRVFGAYGVHVEVFDKIMNRENIPCPFCSDHGFDKIGLKDHLTRCDKFKDTKIL